MTERVINQRKAHQSFLAAFAPVSASLDELVKDKLMCGQFPLTKTGWVKVIAMLVSLAGLALFLAQTWNTCADRPDWYTLVFPVCTGLNIGVQFLFYLIFSCGATVRTPGKWVSADIIVNLIFAFVGIVGSVVTITQNISCQRNETMHNIPPPLGIAGGVLSIIACGAIFLMYRYIEDEEDEPPASPTEIPDPRKSMHA